jgi:hypothetical protein
MRKMSGILLFAATLIAIPVSVRLAMAFFDRKQRQPQSLKPITGRITSIRIESPNYTDTTRVGSRISFDFQIFFHETAKLESAVVYVSGRDHTAYERPLFRSTIFFPYVARKDSSPTFSSSIYVDDVKPEDINQDTLAIEMTDSMGVKYFI